MCVFEEQCKLYPNVVEEIVKCLDKTDVWSNGVDDLQEVGLFCDINAYTEVAFLPVNGL